MSSEAIRGNQRAIRCHPTQSRGNQRSSESWRRVAQRSEIYNRQRCDHTSESVAIRNETHQPAAGNYMQLQRSSETHQRLIRDAITRSDGSSAVSVRQWQSDAHRCNQMQSDAIECRQRSSVAITCTRCCADLSAICPSADAACVCPCAVCPSRSLRASCGMAPHFASAPRLSESRESE